MQQEPSLREKIQGAMQEHTAQTQRSFAEALNSLKRQ
jgi:hypothetical protein